MNYARLGLALVLVPASLFALHRSPAFAQSQDIIFLDMGHTQADASDAPDAGAEDDNTPDMGNAAGDSGIIIEGIVKSLPEPKRPPPPPQNDRKAYEQAVADHARACIQKHAVDDVTVRVGFVYDFDEMSAIATLVEARDTADILVPWFHVALLQAVGTHAVVDATQEHHAFEKCATNVPLPAPVQVSERLSFRLERGTRKLHLREVTWGKKPSPEGT